MRVKLVVFSILSFCAVAIVPGCQQSRHISLTRQSTTSPLAPAPDDQLTVSALPVVTPLVDATPTLQILKIEYNPQLSLPGPVNEAELIRDSLTSLACQFIGTPYREAGISPKGFDCSGFTRYIFMKFGINLPHNSHAQAQVGEARSSEEIKKGDLAFFGLRKKKGGYQITHTGIVISEPGENLRIVHSASGGGVMISEIKKSGYWSRKFLFTKSVIENELN